MPVRSTCDYPLFDDTGWSDYLTISRKISCHIITVQISNRDSELLCIYKWSLVFCSPGFPRCSDEFSDPDCLEGKQPLVILPISSNLDTNRRALIINSGVNSAHIPMANVNRSAREQLASLSFHKESKPQRAIYGIHPLWWLASNRKQWGARHSSYGSVISFPSDALLDFRGFVALPLAQTLGLRDQTYPLNNGACVFLGEGMICKDGRGDLILQFIILFPLRIAHIVNFVALPTQYFPDVGV